MPMYDYQCPGCGTQFEELRAIDERAEAICPKCNAVARKIVNQGDGGGKFHRFPAGWYEHIANKPLFIETKKEMKEACKKHECYAVGVLD